MQVSENVEAAIVLFAVIITAIAGSLASIAVNCEGELQFALLSASTVLGSIGAAILAYWKKEVNVPVN